MAKTLYKFTSGAPSKEPGLYWSCLKSECDMSIRWWDGALWWDISASRGSMAKPFKWPTGAAKRGIPMPRWIKDYHQGHTHLRKISDQSKVRWGIAYKHFEPNEVLTYLVDKGVLPSNWRDAYQEEMRTTQAANKESGHG